MTRTKVITLAGSVGLLVLAAVSWFFLLSPRLEQSAAVRDQADAAWTATAATRQQVAQLTQVRDDMPKRVAELKALTASFPSTAEIPGVLATLRSTAAAAHVSVQTLQAEPPGFATPDGSAAAAGAGAGASGVAAAPTPAPSAAPAAAASGDTSAPAAAAAVDRSVATMQVTMTVKGSFSDLAGFLHRLEKGQRAYLVQSTEVVGGDSPASLVLTVHGGMFVTPAAVAAPATS